MSARAKMILLALAAVAVAAVAIGVVLAGGGDEEPAVKPDPRPSSSPAWWEGKPAEDYCDAGQKTDFCKGDWRAEDRIPTDMPDELFESAMKEVGDEICKDNPENTREECED